MNRIVIVLAAALGGSILAYTANFYAGVDRVAFALTWVLTFAFAAGLVELFRYGARLDGMRAELTALSAREGDGILEAASEPLRGLLRSRLEGGARPVPQPMFTPFLVGLLVMLGLLGTFLGLFETLRGAHAALSESQDVEALRAGLSSPMRGLMRSFGTSAAGVSTSALLGLAAVFARRGTHELTTALAEAVAGPLARLSATNRQLVSIESLSAQGSALPEAAKALSEAAGRLGGLEAVLENALRGVAETFAARSEKGMSEAVSAATALVRESAEAARASAEAEHARLEEWSRRFDVSSRELAEAVKSQAESLERLEQGARERIASSAEHADHQLRDLIEHLEARFSSLESRLADRTSALVESIESRQRAEDDALAERTGRLVDEVGARVGTLVDRFDGAERAQRERAEALHRELLSLAEAQAELAASASKAPAEAAAAVARSLAERGESVLERLAAMEGASMERAAETLARIEGLGATQAEQLAGLFSRQAELEEGLRARAQTWLERIEGLDEGQRARVDSLLGRLDGVDEAQRGRVESLLARLEGAEETQRSRADAILARLDRVDEAQEGRLAALVARLEGAEDAQRGRVESLLTKLAATDESHAARSAELTRSLATLLEEQAHALGVDLQKQAKGFAEGLETAQRTLADAATTLTVAGAELSAVAESFGVSVEHHREGAKAWLASLGELEAAVIQAGEGAAAEALTRHLAHTQELFDRQLRFQRELFAQLRSLRGEDLGSEEDESDAAQ